jgi:molecular chaperone GrpE
MADEMTDPEAEVTDASPENTTETVTDIDTLRKTISELEAKVEAEHNQYLRTMADFQNYRRRADEQRQEVRAHATQELVVGLLPALDNFERALAAAEANSNFEKLIEGVRLTQRQIQDVLKRQNVEPIVALGAEFDPAVHEAIARVEDSEHPDNSVVEEVQRGYTMAGKVLRPALVKVAHNG